MARHRRALLVGFGPSEMCDVLAIHSLLVTSSHFDAKLVMVLSEQRPLCNVPSKPPTVKNVLAGLRWLASQAEDGDVLCVVWIGQRDNAIDGLIKEHVKYVQALIGSLPLSSKLILMLESCPHAKWAFTCSANVVPAPPNAMMVRTDKFRKHHGPMVVLFTSARESDYAHIDVSTSHWHSTFGRALLMGLIGCNPLQASGAEFLAASHRGSKLCSPEHDLICCTYHPSHLYEQGLFDFRRTSQGHGTGVEHDV